MNLSAQIAGHAVLRRHPTVSFTRFGDEGLLVVPKRSWNMVLNGSGARAFELVDGVRTLNLIAETIHREYDAPTVAQVEADVAELFRDLLDRGALERVDG